MAVNKEAYQRIRSELDAAGVTLIAVSKTKPKSDIMELYELGHRDFGENYVQELVDKSTELPADIRWHFIGHLQSNKVKYIANFVHLIHGVDSYKLLKEIDKQAVKAGKEIDCLLQVHIAREETKFGMDESEILEVRANAAQLSNARIKGLMGMASFTEDKTIVTEEFTTLASLFHQLKSRETPEFSMTTLSMGMSADYRLAIERDSTMVRIGSLLFGERV